MMALPAELLVRKSEDEKRRVLESIARHAERTRKAFLFRDTIRPGKNPRFLILIVVGLLVLGGGLIFSARNYAERKAPQDREEQVRRELQVLAGALTLHKEHTGHYPQELVALYEDWGEEGWRGPYITTYVPDPWNRPYGYIPDGTNLPALFSYGPDRKPFTEDDIHATPEDFIVSPEEMQSWKYPERRSPSVQIQEF